MLSCCFSFLLHGCILLAAAFMERERLESLEVEVAVIEDNSAILFPLDSGSTLLDSVRAPDPPRYRTPIPDDAPPSPFGEEVSTSVTIEISCIERSPGVWECTRRTIRD